MSASEVYERVSPRVAFIVTPAGTGSGVLIEGGYVITNYHVVWPYETVQVVFPDGTEFEDISVLGWNPMADLAVLGPVNVSVQPLKLVDGESIPIGSQLFLIGYPAEVDTSPHPTVTGGILSRIREWEPLGMTYLQTDSAVAGGQSGGALVNSKGQLIGISGFSFTEANFALVASSADIAPIVRKLARGEFTSGLGERKLPELGGSFEFDIELLNPWDSQGFVFEATEGATIEIEIDGKGDGRFSVSNLFGLILEVDDGDAGVERATVELEASGVHFLQVELADFDSSEFRLVSSVRLSPLNDPDDGRTIRVGDTVTGSVDYLGDNDWYSIILNKGDTVEIATDSLNVDTWLLIHSPRSPDNQTVADDDGGGGLFRTNSKIIYRAPHSGKHFIVVEDAVDGQVGGYYASVERAPEDAALTPASPPEPEVAEAEARSFANSVYDCLLKSEEGRREFMSEMEESFIEEGMSREDARAWGESLLEQRKLLVPVLMLAIQEGPPSFDEFLAEWCEQGQPPSRRSELSTVDGLEGALNQYFRGRVLHLNVVSLERAPELRYSTIDSNGAVRYWSLTPSKPGSELVLARLKVENHTVASTKINVDRVAAELHDFTNTRYKPVPIAETVWQDFRGKPEALVRIDQGQCFDGSRILVEAGTTVQWQNEAKGERYIVFEDASISVGPNGRAELAPGATLSYTFNEPGNYPYVCSGIESSEWPAEIQVDSLGVRSDVDPRSFLFLRGSYELQKGYGLDGYMVFEVPTGTEFRHLRWTAGDSITIPLDVQAN